VPLYVRVSHTLSPQALLDLYGGMSFYNRIQINDAQGDEIYQTN
jgi:hypothetical protein